jgi:hypothetical protein
MAASLTPPMQNTSDGFEDEGDGDDDDAGDDPHDHDDVEEDEDGRYWPAKVYLPYSTHNHTPATASYHAKH